MLGILPLFFTDMTSRRKIVIWVVLAALATLLSYHGFRGYLAPDLLLNFANSLYC